MAKKSTVEIAEELATPILRDLQLLLWDVTYEKEGSQWFLRFYVDKDGGITIDDCETFSRAIESVLDEKDPISQSYVLEVSSPGIERNLTKPWHYEFLRGETIAVRLIRPVEGVRDFIGELTDYDTEMDTFSILLDEETEMNVGVNETAFVRLYNDYNGGN